MTIHREPGVRDFTADQTAAPAAHQEMSEAQYEEFLRMAREMILVREQKVRTANREAELKSVLMEQLQDYGDPYGQQGQHQKIAFPKAIRGIAAFIRQAKVTTEVNQTRAEAIARQRGIYDRLFKPVMQLDDAAVLVALEEGLLTETDIEEIFVKKQIFAFVPEKAKK